MNINCIICSDLFNPSSEIYSTTCGHTFHYQCLIQWLERSRTCPQCRNKCTEKIIHRIYFNFTNTESIHEDVGTLQHKVDNLEFQIRLKEKDIEIYNEKYKKFKKQNDLLREEIKVVDHKRKVTETAMFALQDQVKYFKSEARDSKKMTSEVIALRAKLREMENLSLVTNGTKQEVNDMMRNNIDANALCLMVVTLKKELVSAQEKRKLMETNVKYYQNNLTKTQKDVNELKEKNDELQARLNSFGTFEQEKEQLRNKLKEYEKKLQDINKTEASPSINRIMNESPIPLSKSVLLKNTLIDESAVKYKSPSLGAKVDSIISSNSPYLSVKASSFTNFNRMKSTNTMDIYKHVSKSSCSQEEEEWSTTPNKSRPTKSESKRPAMKRTASQKFKKLAPINKKMKLIDNTSNN